MMMMVTEMGMIWNIDRFNAVRIDSVMITFLGSLFGP